MLYVLWSDIEIIDGNGESPKTLLCLTEITTRTAYQPDLLPANQQPAYQPQAQGYPQPGQIMPQQQSYPMQQQQGYPVQQAGGYPQQGVPGSILPQQSPGYPPQVQSAPPMQQQSGRYPIQMPGISGNMPDHFAAGVNAAGERIGNVFGNEMKREVA